MSKVIRSGFTLIELVVVLVIFGLLATMALPRYLQQSDESLMHAKHGMSSAVKSSFSFYINQQHTYPTLAELAGQIKNAEAQVQSEHKGLEVVINGSPYLVPTYSNALCTVATSSVHDKVQCVGSIPHPV